MHTTQSHAYNFVLQQICYNLKYVILRVNGVKFCSRCFVIGHFNNSYIHECNTVPRFIKRFEGVPTHTFPLERCWCLIYTISCTSSFTNCYQWFTANMFNLAPSSPESCPMSCGEKKKSVFFAHFTEGRRPDVDVCRCCSGGTEFKPEDGYRL